jgi:transcriptional regulator with XRE-family HTH domain
VAELSIGSRIRERRGKVLTQRQLAERAGVSIDLIRKLEQGVRQTASVGTLQKIARALDIDLSDLVGKPTALLSDDPTAGVVAIRRALTPVDDLLNEVVLQDDAVTLDEARRTLDYAWGAYWIGRYELLGSLLPTALGQLRATVHVAPSAAKVEAHELLARLYWVTSYTLVHLGQPDPAFLAIRQALQVADGGDDELLSASLRCAVSWQLLVQGRYEEARGVAVRAAQGVEPGDVVELPHLSVFGSLLLTAATAAGRDQRIQEAHDLVQAASEVAERIGADRRDYEAYFGPSQVTMQQTDVHIVTENYTAALDAAKHMPKQTGLPLASQARHLADQALAHTRLGNYQRALDALLTAERLGPDWIKYQTLPRQIVAELLDHDRRTPLRSLARRLGVSG